MSGPSDFLRAGCWRSPSSSHAGSSPLEAAGAGSSAGGDGGHPRLIALLDKRVQRGQGVLYLRPLTSRKPSNTARRHPTGMSLGEWGIGAP